MASKVVWSLPAPFCQLIPSAATWNNKIFEIPLKYDDVIGCNLDFRVVIEAQNGADVPAAGMATNLLVGPVSATSNSTWWHIQIPWGYAGTKRLIQIHRSLTLTEGRIFSNTLPGQVITSFYPYANPALSVAYIPATDGAFNLAFAGRPSAGSVTLTVHKLYITATK